MTLNEYLKYPVKEIIEAVGGYYYSNYNNLINNSVWCLAKALSSWESAANSEKDNSDTDHSEGVTSNKLNFKEDEYLQLYVTLLGCPIKSNKDLLDFLSTKVPMDKHTALETKKLLIKNFHCIEIILKQSFFLSSKTFNFLFDYFFKASKDLILLCFELYNSNEDLMILTYPLNVLIKSFPHLKEECKTFFEYTNTNMLKLYGSNPNCYKSINCLAAIYFSILNDSSSYPFFKEQLVEITCGVFSQLKRVSSKASQLMIIESICQVWYCVAEIGICVSIELKAITEIMAVVSSALMSCDNESTTTKTIFKFFFAVISFNVIELKFKQELMCDITATIINSIQIVDSATIGIVNFLF